jgi:transcriptional regulator with XRE-family HTH domain
MTPTERRAALQSIGWTQRGLADRIGYDEGTIRRLFRDPSAKAPPGVDEWLATLARFHDEHPPPERASRVA